MKIPVITDGIARISTGALACCFVFLLSLPVRGSGTDIIDITLPWDYVVEEMSAGGGQLLQAADEQLTAGLRTVERVDLGESEDAYLRLQYRRAVFGNRNAADRAFAGLPTETSTRAEDRERWDIILQAQNELHWLNSACVLPRSAFQQVYAGLVESVEKKGVVANRALLCRCGAKCAEVAVDR